MPDTLPGYVAGSAWAFFIDGVACYRLTRLITADTILDGPRDALVRRAYRRPGFRPAADEDAVDYAIGDPNAPRLATLATCRFCAGVYVGFGVMIARRRFPRQWAPIAEALALSAGAALIAGLED